MSMGFFGGIGGAYPSFGASLTDIRKLLPEEQSKPQVQGGSIPEQSQNPYEAKEAEDKRIEQLQKMGINVPGHEREKNLEDGKVIVKNPGESTEKISGKKSSPAECQTCAERKYQDGSDEMVSFKSAQHIDPAAAAARVRGHEQEHVVNAYKEAEQDGGKVLSCNVAIHTAICPECGRTYVSGGTTTTKIAHPVENHSFKNRMKDMAGNLARGLNVDMTA